MLIALLYEAIGVVLAWIIKQFFWVPHQFRYGILVAGGWGNVGDIRELIDREHLLALILFFFFFADLASRMCSEFGHHECDWCCTI